MTKQPKGGKGFKSLGELASKVSLPDRKQRNSRIGYLTAALFLLCLALSAIFYGKEGFQYLASLFSNFQPSHADKSPNFPQRTPPQNTPAIINRAQFEIREPPVNPNHKHALPEIRWCFALSRFLENMRKTLHDSGNMAAYNDRVEYYNARCSKFSANAQTLALAKKDIDSLSDSDLDYMFGIRPETAGRDRKLTENQLAELQSMLVQLGYMDESVSGKINEQTALAIKAFQKDIGKPQTGSPDLETFTYLQIVYEDLLTWLETGEKPAWLK